MSNEMLLLLPPLLPNVKKGLLASIKNIVDVHWTCVCRGRKFRMRCCRPVAGDGGGKGYRRVFVVSETLLALARRQET